MSLMLREGILYINGTNFAGRVEEIELPEIEFGEVEMKPMGLLGGYSAAGPLQPLSGKMTLYGYDSGLITQLSNPRLATTCLIRGTQERTGISGVEEEVAVAWTLQVRPIKQTMGTLNQDDALMREIEFQTSQIQVEVAGATVLKIDIFAYLYEVDGTNLYAARRANLGLGG